MYYSFLCITISESSDLIAGNESLAFQTAAAWEPRPKDSLREVRVTSCSLTRVYNLAAPLAALLAERDRMAFC